MPLEMIVDDLEQHVHGAKRKSSTNVRLEPKSSGRRKDGTGEGSQSVTHRDGQRSQRQRTPPVLARAVQALGEGGQRLAERELGWNRGTIRKGQHELEQGIVCLDAFSSPGRKRSEEHLPNLLTDITTLADGQSQADPQFRTNRLYTRLTATEVRRQFIAQKGYREDELPTAETISTKLNELGYDPKKVAKSQPQKNCPKPMPSLPK